jgi:hypothetical protein
MTPCTATYLSPLLAHCCKALGMSVGLAATPPYKSLIYNALCSAGCFLARIFFCLTQTTIFVSRRLRRKRRDFFRSHTESTENTDLAALLRSQLSAMLPSVFIPEAHASLRCVIL